MGAPLTATDEDLQRLAHHRMVVRQCARRYRARKRNGARCLRIEISNAEQTLDAFVKIGVLAEERRNNDRAIETAISVLCQRGYRAVKAERETDRDNNRSLPRIRIVSGDIM
jgi:predicted GNAT superfamily acetyltransferase